MSHVDFFSRNPLPPPTVKVFEKLENKRVDFNQLTDNWLIEQQRDPEVSKLVTDLAEGKLPDDISKTYDMRSDVLHR